MDPNYGGNFQDQGQGNPPPRYEDDKPDAAFISRMRELENDFKNFEATEPMPPTNTSVGMPQYPQTSQTNPGFQPSSLTISGGGHFHQQQHQDYSNVGPYSPQAPGQAPGVTGVNQMQYQMKDVNLGGNMMGQTDTISPQHAPQSNHGFQPVHSQAHPGEAYPPPGVGGQFGNPSNSYQGQAPGGVSVGNNYPLPQQGGSGYGHTQRPSYAQTAQGGMSPQTQFGGGPGQYDHTGQAGVQGYPSYGQNAYPVPPQQTYNPGYGMQAGSGHQGFVQTPQGGASNYPYAPQHPSHINDANWIGDDGKQREGGNSDSDPEPKKGNKEDKGGKGGKQKTPTKKDPSKRQPKTFDVVDDPEDLPKSFGKSKALSESDAKFKSIRQYVRNGTHCQETRVGIKIHQILEIGKSWNLPTLTGKSKQLLLWWKTTPGSVKRLAQQQDGCVALYDVITRAYVAPPSELEGPVRQTVLLCSVSLGKTQESPHGFHIWKDRQFPQGYHSVKGVGKLTPDPQDDRDDNSTIVPCGKVVKDRRFRSYEQDYSEYMVHEAKRVTVRYAVDVELTPQ